MFLDSTCASVTSATIGAQLTCALLLVTSQARTPPSHGDARPMGAYGVIILHVGNLRSGRLLGAFERWEKGMFHDLLVTVDCSVCCL